MEKLLSIVIPVYNVEPYIRKCLDSLLIFKKNEFGQDTIDDELMSLIDIIVVNDGTTDNSAEISREYANKYPLYFRQIDKENGGHGSVWNLGVEEAKGKYLRFLDSDDWLENLDTFLKKLRDSDSDLILTRVVDHCAGNKIWMQQILDMEFYKSYDANTFDWMGNRTHNYLMHHCCTYKTKVLRQWMPGLFLENQPYDDVVLWPAALIGADSIEAFDFSLYHYLMDRPGQSISADVFKRNTGAQIRTAQHTIEFYEKHPVDTHSTKSSFISSKRSGMYREKYRSLVKLPYKDGKVLLNDWDKWAKQHNPDCHDIIVVMYRMLPYFVYRPFCLICQQLWSKIRKAGGVGTYILQCQ